MNRAIEALLVQPYPMRSLVTRVIRLLKVGGYEARVRLGAVHRPHYAYCVLNAALLGRKLGYHRISVIEYGVADGNGLVALEDHAQQVARRLQVQIDVYGFDTGKGLPQPLDFRDLPYHWREGFFRADVDAVQRRLRSSTLLIGDIGAQSSDFFEKYDPAPIGAIMYDLDLYSSTVAALKMLEAPERYYLPRVFCYFDDIIGSETELYNDYTGERLAISEFNEAHRTAKIAEAYHLMPRSVVDSWCHQIRICHFFEHGRYNDFVSAEDPRLCPE